MIAIIGVTEDDILYFKTKMTIKETVKLYGETEAYVGSFSTDEAVLVACGNSNYISGIITSQIISKFEPYLIINIGVITSFSNSLHQGDIFIADRYYFAGVDFSESRLGTYGQIPGMPYFYVGDTNLNSKAESAAYAMTSRYVMRGYLLSGEKTYFNQGSFDHVVQVHYITEEGMNAYDTSSGGMALACYLGQTTLLSIKAVCLQAGQDDQKLNYIRKGLEVMPTIGKVVTKLLIEKESV